MPSKVSEQKAASSAHGELHGASQADAAREFVSGIVGEIEIGDRENTPQLAELRKIIVHSETVSEVLPAAVTRSAEKDHRLAEATLPLVEDNIRQSIQRNPQILAEAIFPIIGPAIRKAISEALSQMVQSFNQTLEHSFSSKGFRWRMEAWRTGKPFGEVVILNSLLYRVEQVFLIHRETGILLNHLSAQNAAANDAEMVSGMLTAIQDFVQDSFKNSDGATLDALRVHELSVWIEYGADTILAVVIRGNAPLGLRGILTENLERIQIRYDRDFDEFRGETARFEDAKPLLQDCLREQEGETKEVKKSVFTPVNFLAAIALVLILIAGFFYVRDYLRWSDYLARLKNEPGIAVTTENRGIFKHEIAGLRSDRSIDPESLLPAYNLKSEDVESRWQMFADLSPQTVLERARKILKPPPDVELNYQNGVLTVRGNPSNEWLLQARELSQAIGGITEFKVIR